MTTGPKKKHYRRSIFTILFTLFCLMFIGFVLYSFYINQQWQQQAQAQIRTLSSTVTSAKQQQREVNQHADALDKAIETIGHQYQSIDWRLSKTRYYLELAQINATWSNDIASTKALLQNADALLTTLPSPSIVPVRQAIANELTQIQAITPIDYTGLLTQLNALQQMVDHLPLKQAIVNSNPPSQHEHAMTPWQVKLKTSVEQLKQLVVIQHHDEALQPLITPAYDAMLRETIRLNLQQAQWAVLEHNNPVFQLALTQATHSVFRFFVVKTTQTKAFLDQLQQLQATNLVIDKIIPSESLPLLDKIIQSKDTAS